MGNESGTWIMYGVEPDDPECIHTVDEAIKYINEVGFLPLFKNEIPGFSLEERTTDEMAMILMPYGMMRKHPEGRRR